MSFDPNSPNSETSRKVLVGTIIVAGIAVFAFGITQTTQGEQGVPLWAEILGLVAFVIMGAIVFVKQGRAK